MTSGILWTEKKLTTHVVHDFPGGLRDFLFLLNQIFKRFTSPRNKNGEHEHRLKINQIELFTNAFRVHTQTHAHTHTRAGGGASRSLK